MTRTYIKKKMALFGGGTTEPPEQGPNPGLTSLPPSHYPPSLWYSKPVCPYRKPVFFPALSFSSQVHGRLSRETSAGPSD